DKAVLGMGLSADGKTLLTADHYGTARVWDLADRKLLRSFDTAAERQHSHRLAPDGQTFVYTTADGLIVVRDTAEGKELQRLKGTPKSLRLAYTPDSRALLTAEPDGVVNSWDLQTGEKRKVAECQLARPKSIGPSDRAWFAADGRS